MNSNPRTWFSERFRGGRAWFVAIVIVAFGLGFVLRGGGGSHPDTAESPEADREQAEIWTCSMHPQIHLPKPGKCPICAMDLIPLAAGDAEELGPRMLELTETAAALAEIQTVPVARKSVAAEVRLLGKVDYDETSYRTITSWVPGRIDTLFVDFTGTSVRQGQKLVSLYSPELYAAQTELFNAIEAEQELANSDNAVIRRTATATVSAARERLRLWGLTPEQVAVIEDRGVPTYHLAITSPLSGVVVHKDAIEGLYVKTGTRIYTVADLSHVWVTLDAYESDLVWLEEGQTIQFSVEAVPGRAFEGTIVFIDPFLNERTRTVMVRLDVKNDRGLLKPGMFVHAVADAAVTAPAGAEAATPLVIPISAPLITGKRAVVYVRVPGREKPTFEGREIVLGPRAGDHFIVESGLAEGELVVVKGNFKIDSALQIQAKPSMMSPEGGAPPPGHHHGPPPAGGSPVGSGQAPDHAAHAMPERYEAPAEFLDQLGGVLDAYAGVQEALATDDDGLAATAAAGVEAALAAVDMSLLKGAAHMAWMDDLSALREAQTGVGTAKDISARRDAFMLLSDRLWAALRRYSYRGHRTARLFHCPMANAGAGADWIQFDDTTANPYYGSAMPRCGSQTDSLATVHDHAGGE